jgi:hypothetical protein
MGYLNGSFLSAASALIRLAIHVEYPLSNERVCSVGSMVSRPRFFIAFAMARKKSS